MPNVPRDETRALILRLVAEAESQIPRQIPLDLPPGRFSAGSREWHPFEKSVWQIGETIRQHLLKQKPLRDDLELQNAFVRVSLNRNAKAGRQSFVMLLGFVSCRVHAVSLASQLDDYDVAGHVIGTLLKMRADGFVGKVRPFMQDRRAWIRQKAKLYCERYPNTVSEDMT